MWLRLESDAKESNKRNEIANTPRKLKREQQIEIWKWEEKRRFEEKRKEKKKKCGNFILCAGTLWLSGAAT